MAIGAATVWRFRPGGNAANGGAFDGTIAGAGTDYSQQDAAQASGTVGTATGTTTFTDAGGLFTSQMVGNALRIASGAGFTVGHYFIITFNSSTSVVLDRSPGTGTVAQWKLGGALTGAPFKLADSARAAGDHLVAGNSVGLWGASGVVASPDYSWTGISANPPVAGDTTNGAITWFGEGPNKPILTRTDGDIVFANGGDYHHFTNFYYKAGASASSRMFDSQFGWQFEKVTFDLNDLDISALINAGCLLIGCEALSKTSGTPTSRTTAVFSTSGSLPAFHITKCNFHDLGGPLLSAPAGVIIDSKYVNSVKEFVINASADNRGFMLLQGNTVDKNLGDIVSLTTAIAVATTVAFDNILSNNTGTSKTALKLTGTTALNDRLKAFMDYNDYFNNTANYSNVSAGANDLTLDPQYTSSPSNETIGTNLKAQGYPRTNIIGNVNERSYTDIGALQRQEPSASGVIIPNIIRNIFITEDQLDGP